MTAARKLKSVEVNDGSYGGGVLAVFDAHAAAALADRALIDGFPSFPMSEAQRRAVPVEQFNALAHSIAYDHATFAVEGCRFIGASEGCSEWWELPSQPDELALIADDLKYLDARGLIERHPHMENWIALVDESEATR